MPQQRELPVPVTLADGVRFSAVCDDRQRGCLLAVHFYFPHSAENAAAAALLTDLLTASSADFPAPGAVTAQLDSLYAADFSASLTVSGDTADLSFTATWLDDAYALHGEAVTAEVLRLVTGCLRRPHRSAAQPDAFNEAQFDICLANLLDDLEGAVNNKRTYALQQAAALAFAGEPAAVPPAGTPEAARALTPQSVYRKWQEILQTAPADLIAVMPAEKPEILQAARAIFADLPRSVQPVQFDAPGARRNTPARQTEVMPVSQTRLVMTYKYDSMDRQTLTLLTAMLTDTGSSLLFANVREKARLCYDCSAFSTSAKHALTIECGIRAADAQAAEEKIAEQIRLLAAGDWDAALPALCITQAESNAAASLDTAGGIAVWLAAAHRLCETRTPAAYYADARRISAETLTEAAKRLRLDAVYLLLGSAGEEGDAAWE